MFFDLFKNISNCIEGVDRRNPSFFILIGLLFSLILLIAFDLDLLESISISFFCIGIALIVFPKKVFLKFALWILIGFVAFAISCGSLFQNTVKDKLILGKKYVIADVTDFRAVGDYFDWLHNPSYVEVEIKKYRINRNDKWKSCSVKAVAKLKRNSQIKFGDSLKLFGNIELPKEPALKGDFNYKNYLNSLGIHYIFYGNIEEISSCADFSFFNSFSNLDFRHEIKCRLLSNLFNFRNKLLKSLCVGISNREVKTFLAGVVFGCRQGISLKTKKMFINNGIIHILAISGLHVGILAVILMIIFRFLPIKIRFFLIPIFLFIYILISGFQVSAVRAFVMISLFCIFKALFLSDKSFNNIVFAAVILIICNPYSILSAGFQFSFIVAGILVLSWKRCIEWKNSLFEKQNLVVAKKISRFQKNKRRIYEKLFNAIFVCIIAGIASCGLTLFYQKLIIPLMPILNFIIVPLMFPIFFISIIKIVLILLFGNFLNILLNAVLCFCVDLIFHISALSNSLSTTIHTVYTPFFLIFSFYISVLILIFCKQKFLKLASLLVCCFVLLFGVCKDLMSNSQKIFIIKPAGDGEISYVCYDSCTSSACVINLPKGSAYIVKGILENNNIKSVKSIFLLKTTKSYCANAEYLIKFFNVEKITISEESKNSKYLSKLKNECKADGIEITRNNFIKNSLYDFEFGSDKKTFKLTYIIPDDIYTLDINRTYSGIVRLMFRKNGVDFRKIKILNSNQCEIIEI
jgi:ComEC/Rec2-related protein